MLPMSKTPRIQLWLDRLRRHAASQLTVVDFCRLDQISVASFYKWKLRLSQSVDSAPRVDSVPKRRKGKLAASHRFTEPVVQSATTPHANTPHATLAGGERSAGLMSLVSSAHRNDLDVWAYVNDVLGQLLAGETDYQPLLPWNWAALIPSRSACIAKRSVESGTFASKRSAPNAATTKSGRAN